MREKCLITVKLLEDRNMASKYLSKKYEKCPPPPEKKIDPPANDDVLSLTNFNMQSMIVNYCAKRTK